MAGLDQQPLFPSTDEASTLYAQQMAQIEAKRDPVADFAGGAIVLALYVAAAIIGFLVLRAIWRRAKFWPSRIWQHFMSMLRDIRNATR